MSTTIAHALLAEFDHEMANTRTTLERVPEDRPDYRPHARSMTLSRLAGHVSEFPLWAIMTLTQDELDVNPAGGQAGSAAVMESRAAMLKTFDDNLVRARAALASSTDEAMMSIWSLKNGGKTLLALPKVAVMRGFVLNHMVHHRAQLGVYLRLNDVAVPALYGPTADEGTM